VHPLSLSLMYIDIESMKEDLQAIKGASAVMTTTTTTTSSSSSAIVTSSKHDINKHSNINDNGNENDNDDIDDNHNDNQWRKDLDIYPYVHDLKSVDSVVKEIVKVLSKGSNGKQYGVDDSLHIIKLLQMVRER